MKFAELAKVFSKIEVTTLRNEKTQILAELLGTASVWEMSALCYLSTGQLGPLYDPLEFGLAEKMVVRAIAFSLGKPVARVIEMFKKSGDAGDVMRVLGFGFQVSGIQVLEIHQELMEIARDRGVGSQERKIQRLGKLLAELDLTSAKYVVRLVTGKLRLGFSDLTILDALSLMGTGDKSDREELERAFNVQSDMGLIAKVYKAEGVAGLAKLGVTPGRPVRPMRAERLGTTTQIVEKLGRQAVEPKFDGLRVQVHCWSNELNPLKIQVKIFSRGLEDITKMFPDIVEAARKLHAKTGDFVLDGEAIGVDPKTGKFLPFQETMKRKRKYDVAETAVSIPLVVCTFDILYYDGAGTLEKEYVERRKILEKIIAKANIFVLAESHVVETEKEMRALFDRYVDEKLEGMLCKRLDSHYMAGARNFNWVKYKRSHETGLADTVDVVVMGGYVGKGKREKFGIGAFLVGVQHTANSELTIQTVAKIGTGLTDVQFAELFSRMQKVKSDDKPNEFEVPKSLTPDFWVTPSIIVEIEADEITKSPLHTSGYALRFPRLIQFRDDKKCADITTGKEVESLFRF